MSLAEPGALEGHAPLTTPPPPPSSEFQSGWKEKKKKKVFQTSIAPALENSIKSSCVKEVCQRLVI